MSQQDDLTIARGVIVPILLDGYDFLVLDTRSTRAARLYGKRQCQIMMMLQNI